MGRSSPDENLLLLEALRKKGHVVAATGKGIRDAPSLRQVLKNTNLCFETLKMTLKMIIFPTTAIVVNLIMDRRRISVLQWALGGLQLLKNALISLYWRTILLRLSRLVKYHASM